MFCSKFGANHKRAIGKTTIKDVAEAAGVSVGLVFMVLNNKKGVNKHTAERIFKIADDMKYTPNKTAFLPSTALRNMVCLLCL